VSSKRSKPKIKERVRKDAQCIANRGGEGEKKREEKKKERKNKEIGNCLPQTRYAPSTAPGVYFI
jgi:hypothetical protein